MRVSGDLSSFLTVKYIQEPTNNKILEARLGIFVNQYAKSSKSDSDYHAKLPLPPPPLFRLKAPSSI